MSWEFTICHWLNVRNTIVYLTKAVVINKQPHTLSFLHGFSPFWIMASNPTVPQIKLPLPTYLKQNMKCNTISLGTEQNWKATCGIFLKKPTTYVITSAICWFLHKAYLKARYGIHKTATYGVVAGANWKEQLSIATEQGARWLYDVECGIREV